MKSYFVISCFDNKNQLLGFFSTWSKKYYKGEQKQYVVLAASAVPYLGHLYTTEKAAKANLERVIKCGHIEDFRKIVTFKVQKMTFNFEDIA